MEKVKQLVQKVRDFFSDYGCLIVLLLVISAYVGYCTNGKIQKRLRQQYYKDSIQHAKDSIQHAKDSIQHVKDSLENDPHYQDSLRIEREKREAEWQREMEYEDEHTLVLVSDIDTIYHYTTVCLNLLDMNDECFLGTKDINRYYLTTRAKAKKRGYTLCNECEERDDIYREVEDGEYIRREDAIEYDLIPIDEADEYCSHRNYY